MGEGDEGPAWLKVKLMLPEGEVKQELEGLVGELENSEMDRFLFITILTGRWFLIFLS